MRLARLVPLALVLALLPATALAAGPTATRVRATKDAIASHVSSTVTSPMWGQVITHKDVRVRTRTDPNHGPHTHIVGHDPRLVTFTVPSLAIKGTATSNTTFVGSVWPTSVSNIVVTSVPPAPVLPNP